MSFHLFLSRTDVNLNNDDTLSISALGKVVHWIGGEFYDLNGSKQRLQAMLAPNINARSLVGKIRSRNSFKVGHNYSSRRVFKTIWLHLSVNEHMVGVVPRHS